MRILLVAAAALVAGACSETPEQTKSEPRAKALQAGQWEITSETTQLKPLDKTEPKIKAKAGDKETASFCLAQADVQRPPAALFDATGGDTCNYDSFYLSNGRLNVSALCRPQGMGGEVGVVLSGTFTADSFELEERASSAFPGQGDFELTQKVTGRRTGECVAEAGAKG